MDDDNDLNAFDFSDFFYIVNKEDINTHILLLRGLFRYNNDTLKHLANRFAKTFSNNTIGDKTDKRKFVNFSRFKRFKLLADRLEEIEE